MTKNFLRLVMVTWFVTLTPTICHSADSTTPKTDSPQTERAALDLTGLQNPVWQRQHGVRDPAVLPVPGGYNLYYNRPEGGKWGDPQNWSVCSVFTPDFKTFRDDRQITPHGYASPDVAMRWHERWILPYQRYPINPVLCYSASADGQTWGPPVVFLEEAVQLVWNTHRRLIDPTFVVDGDTLHCFFIGSCSAKEKNRHANLLGHATTTDPGLKQWTILTRDAPLLGIGEDAPDGVENVTVLKRGDEWTMIYSEGLQRQHLAYGVSPDLVHWTWKGAIDVPRQDWMATRYGAPFVWREPNQWMMILMGCDAKDLPQVGLLSSTDGLRWTLLPQRPASQQPSK